MMALTESQVQAIDVTEKVCSICSVLGEIFVITTFLFSNRFRKPVNRLVFYATWGNMLTNIATLIGKKGINMGLASPLCQFQAFIIHWFMPADALWALAMACNVWLSFFHQYGAPKLRALEWKYLLFCYGLPFIPAFTFLFVENSARGKVYGDAVLWCWVSIEWDILRVSVFYAPIWVVIAFTIAIYLRVGVVVYKLRRQLVSFEKRSPERQQHGNQHSSIPINVITRTDEVSITEVTLESPAHNQFLGLPHTEAPQEQRERSLSARLRDRTLSLGIRGRSVASKGTSRKPSSRTNDATVKYYKCAVLFFFALLVTWLPSSINRIHTLIHPDDSAFGLQFAAALVLPLQGFWNAVVYVATSVYACKCLWQDLLMTARLRKESSSTTQTEKISGSFDSRIGWPAGSDTLSLKPTGL